MNDNPMEKEDGKEGDFYLKEWLQATINRYIQKFQAGEPGAFEELWQNCANYVYRHLRFRVGGNLVLTRQTARKLTRDVCHHLGNYLEDHAKGNAEDFWEWLNNVSVKIKKRALRYYEVKGLSLDKPLPPEEEGDLIRAMHQHTPTPLEILIRQEDKVETRRARNLLDAVLDKLSPIEKYVIFARFYDKQDYKVISQRLYGDESKADYLCDDVLREALRKMKRIYEKDYGIKEIPF